jgi:O-antigen ligase
MAPGTAVRRRIGIPVPRRGRRRPVSLIDTVANAFTVASVFFSPAITLPAGLSFGDMFLILALLLRSLQLVTTGLDLEELRNHDLLLVVFSAIAVGGLTSGVVNGQPLDIFFLRMVLATFGTLLAVAFYGQTRDRLKTLVRSFALGCAFLAISGELKPKSEGRAFGFTFHPNLFAHSLVMGTMACTACFFWTTNRWARALWATCAVLCLYGIWDSGSRGALAGIWLAMVLYVGLSGRRWLVLGALAVTWCIAIVFVAGVVNVGETSALGRLVHGNSDTNVQGSNNERSQSFKNDVEIITEKPIFGEGFAKSILVHMVYFQAWTSAGLLGFAAIMLLGISMFALPFGRPRAVLALPCAVAGVAGMWFFTNILGTRDQWFFIVLAYRMARTSPDPLPELEPATEGVLAPAAGT